MPKKYYQEDTLGRRFLFKDEDAVLFDPTSIEIDIINPAGTGLETKLDIDDLVKEAVGTYKLIWTIPSDAMTGQWRIKVTANYAPTALHKTEYFYFEVIAG